MDDFYQMSIRDIDEKVRRNWALGRIRKALGPEEFEAFMSGPEKLREDTITVFLRNTDAENRKRALPHNATERGTYIKSHNRRIGRNDPCFCGSGKKYKRCCL